MRACEFIVEDSKIPKDQLAATPDLRKHPNLDNSSPYDPWRFSAHFLPGADGKNPYEHKPERHGPTGQALVTASYTPEEAAMIDQAEKAFGSKASHKKLSSQHSVESDEVHKVSPMNGFKGYPR